MQTSPVVDPQSPETLSIADSNRSIRAGPATAQIAATNPAVMRVMRTQPGTSPLSFRASETRTLNLVNTSFPFPPAIDVWITRRSEWR